MYNFLECRRPFVLSEHFQFDASKRWPELEEMLCNGGAPPPAAALAKCASDGYSAHHIALVCGAGAGTVRALLAAGADPAAVNDLGRTALHIA
eukprot:gene327-5320_t